MVYDINFWDDFNDGEDTFAYLDGDYSLSEQLDVLPSILPHLAGYDLYIRFNHNMGRWELFIPEATECYIDTICDKINNEMKVFNAYSES